MKVIIFDAGTLISLSMNGLLNEVRELKKSFDGKFIITKEVKMELIDKPMTVKRFEFEALMLNQLLKDGVLEMSDALDVDANDITKSTNQFLDVASRVFSSNKKDIHLIDLGEASCLALSKILDVRDIEHAIAIDERTTRMLSERPNDLKKILQKKLHVKIHIDYKTLKKFEGFRFIRSAELVYMIYKKGIIKIDSPKLLEALLYAVKFKGCSIRDDEIRIIKSLKG